MAATKDDLRQWFRAGLLMEAKPTHMVIVCDTFDYDDYPVYATSTEMARLVCSDLGQMQRVMEVYDLRMDMEDQMSERRAWHF